MRILYFSPIYYDDMKQRPQQIAECLAKKHEVFYVEPTVSLIRWLLKGGRSFAGKKKSYGRLKVIRPNGALTFHKSVEILDICGINNWSELFQLRRLITYCDVIWIGYCGWYTLIRHIRHKPVVYDKMDKEDMLVASKLFQKTLKRNNRRLCKLADAVIVTSRQLYDQVAAGREHVYLVPNAVSDRFTSESEKVTITYDAPDLKNISVFGYVGTMDSWFDLTVIEKILMLNAKYKVVLVGRNYLKEVEKLAGNPRVRYLGVKKNRELAKIIQTFDVCLYNFKRIPLLDTINPVKIYEYLSLNKPVLAVKSRETVKLGKYVSLYENTDEIEQIISTKLKRPFSEPQSLRRFLEENSWMARTAEINEILREVT